MQLFRSPMLGTTHTTRPFTRKAALVAALRDHAGLGAWSIIRETGYTRTGHARPQFVGVIWADDRLAAHVRSQFAERGAERCS